MVYQVLADVVLAVHVAVVVFVVGGLLCILVGNVCGWGWVNRRLFRYTHLAAIGVVILQAWLGALAWPLRPALVARNPVDGKPLWAQALPAPPQKWGLAVDRDGRVVLTLIDGRTVCFAAAQ